MTLSFTSRISSYHQSIRIITAKNQLGIDKSRIQHFTTLNAGTSKIHEALQRINLENNHIKADIGSEEYNFMSTASRELRKIEISHGAKCINPIMEMLLDPTFEGPGARLLIGSLTRLVPTRQSCFERLLDTRYPTWQSFLMTSSPQDSYPLEFHLAGEEARKMWIEYPDRLVECIEKNLQSKYPDVLAATLQSCAKIGDSRLIKMCMEHLDSEDKTVRNTAIISCAQLSVLDKKTKEFFRHFLYSNAPIDEKNMAFEAFMDVFPSEDSRNIITGIIKDPDLRELVQSHGFLNSLLDLPREDLKQSMEELVPRFNLSELTDSSLMRVIRSNLLNHKIRSDSNKALKARDSYAETLRGAKLTISRYGLLVHRASTYWVGHTGIFVSEDQVIDMNVGRGHDAVKQISYARWQDGQQCWGVRKEREGDGHQVDLNKAVSVARDIASWKTEYDWDHLHQKGKWNKPWSCRAKYWEADCVGFTEYVYERAGGDPIPKEEESWPITPRQQRDRMTKVLDC